MPTKNNNKWMVFVGAGLMILLVNIDVTIVNLALATISRDLQTSLTQIQWIINSYLLTTMIFFIVGGKLADIHGHKTIYLIGVVFFGLASLMAGLSHHFTLLIIARLLQGIGFAFTLGLALLMITDAFPSEQRGFAIGLSVTITGLGQALGPTVGGAILEELNWHWIFLINVPIAIVSFIIIALFVEKTVRKGAKPKVDYPGVVLLGLALTLLLLTINTLSRSHFNAGLFALGVVASMAAFIILYIKERNTEFPLIDFSLFSRREYSLSIAIRFFFMYTMGAFLFFIPLFLQNTLGHTPLLAGLMMLVYSALFAIASPMAGIWCDQSGYKPPIIFAMIVCLFGYVLLKSLAIQSPMYLLLSGLGCIGLGAGILIPSTVNSALSALPKASLGEGLGMFFTFAFIAVSLGVAISGSQVHLVSTHTLMSSHQTFMTSLTEPAREMMYRVANGTMPGTKLQTLVEPTNYTSAVQIAKHSFMKGFSSVMLTNIAFALIATILGLALRRKS